MPFKSILRGSRARLAHKVGVEYRERAIGPPGRRALAPFMGLPCKMLLKNLVGSYFVVLGVPVPAARTIFSALLQGRGCG